MTDFMLVKLLVVLGVTVCGVLSQCAGGGTSNTTAQCTDDPAYAAACQGAFCNNTATLNPDACSDPTFQALLPHCAATCDMCAELGFGCNNTIPEEDCAALAANCDDPNMFPIMNAYCPRTCGFCPKPNGGANCQDKAENCSALADYCENPLTYDQLTQECPKTCKRCPAGTNGTMSTSMPGGSTPIGGGCIDYASNCLENIALCNDALYSPLMHQQCQKTCQFCNGGSGGFSVAPCVDNNQLCATFVANGFCTNPNYTAQQKKDACAKSCGLC